MTVGGRGLRYARWAKRFLTFAELPEEPRFRRSYTLYDPDDLAGLLSPDLRGQVDEVIDGHREIYTDNDLHDEVNRMCLADARLFLPGLNLAYTDRSSMAASVEVRVPFVDPVVAQAAFAIPGRDKIRNRQGKVALKRAAEKWLPHEIVYRPKASFSAPLRAWVRNDLQEVINDVLVRGELVGSGMIRAGALDRLIAGRAGGPRGQRKADMAAADDGAVVPQRAVHGRRGMTDKDTMKQIAQNYKSGELTVLDAPVPACRPGGVLVQSLFSLISTGTEMMKVHEANLSMVGKARARPDQVRKVLDTVAQQGAMATYKKVMNKLDSYTPLGYSLCGVVIEVGAGAEEFKVGQLVAAAGNEYALHAEYNWIPVNLCAAVPRGVAPEHAAFATVGAIAMQGVRRAEPQLGETSLVIGLGLIGQLVVRLLVAAGIRVVGLDVIEARCRLAEQAGAVACAAPDDEGLAAVAASLDELTSGRGADHVFLAAGGSSNAPVETAAKLARDRARVVDIGKTKLDLPWNAYYDKELDVRFSRSYGPGRYDDRYELEGVDYPAGYVRWTERRNLECFLDLLARKDLEVETLVSGTFPMHDAGSVYADLSSGALKAVGVLLYYPAPDPERQPRPAASLVRAGVPSAPARVSKGPNGPASKRLAIGFIGAGNYASSMLLPHLAQLPNAQLTTSRRPSRCRR